MILNLGSLAFNANLKEGGGTPTWGTELGQGQGYRYNFEDSGDLLTSMLYMSVPDITKVTCPLGKGGGRKDDYEFVLASLYDKIYVNGSHVKDAKFLLLIVKQIVGDFHIGRRSIKYNPRMSYNGVNYNESCYKLMAETLKISSDAAWFVDEIFTINQDELHFVAYVLDANGEKKYTSNEVRKQEFLNKIRVEKSTNKVSRRLGPEFSQEFPLQKISYGAPGTGKSHGTNKVVRSYKDTVRTTFHPDSDYSTFVGSYKPTTTKEPVLGLFGKDTVQLIDPSTGEPLETTKIVYKFIKQAFLKAYVRAWKKMAKNHTVPKVSVGSTPAPIVLTHATNKNFQWVITEITESEVYLTAHEVYNLEKFKEQVQLEWSTCWKDDSYSPTLTVNNRPQMCVCNWMAELEEGNFETRWAKFIEELSKGEMELNVDPEGGAKPYFFSIDSENNIKMTRNVCGKKETVIKKMKKLEQSTNYQQAVANYLKEQYKSSNPNEAWDRLKDDVKGTTTSSTTTADTLTDIRQFLVIEEINRGNCAQIFGDLFQLLDRKNGFSEYPIEADEDIQKALLDENPDDGLSFGKDGLTLPEEVKNELRRVFEGDANPDAIIKKICMGKVLVLPRNLYIWATMNTSDQSLFPIDSAFKRRWDWEYVPIKNHSDENWKIKIENETYDWWKFLVKVNNIINELTSSEDKKLGYFFAKAQNKVVDTNTMVNKVFFYLWNDIFKDFDLNHSSIDFPKIKDNDKERPYAFGDFFSEEGEISVKSVSTFMKELVPEANETPTASGPAATEETEKTEEPEELTAE